MLRYEPSIGPGTETQFSRYLSLPLPPTYLGFDPRIQLVHEQDAIDAFIAAVKRPVRGAVNVAGPGTVGLTKMLRMAGRQSMPILSPLFPTVNATARRLGMYDFSPDFTRLLRYGRGVDTTRLVEEIGFRPSYTTVEAVADYARKQTGRRLAPTVRQAVVGR
jgi:UDP-glucose 4-epimerase